MKKLMIFCAVLIALFVIENAYSQGSFTLHAGPSFPLSDFGDDSYDDAAGGAGVGFNLGGKYVSKLNDKGLGVYLGADYILNGLKGSVKDEIQDMFEGVDILYYKYINVPVTAGLNYTYKANEQVSLFADLGLGADYCKVTDMVLGANNQKAEFNFNSSIQFAYKFGGGLLIQNKYIVGLYYNGLGKHNIKGVTKYNGLKEHMDDLDLKVDVLTLTIGIIIS